MSYIANQYNYATPLTSTTSITSETVISDKKHFSLFDNTLDGSYFPIEGDVGLWGTSVANSDGTLPTPFILTVNEQLTFNAFRLMGNSRCYPVDFTVEFYNGSTLLHAITEVGNTLSSYVYYFDKTLVASAYVVTVTRVSMPGVAIIYNSYNLGYVKRSDTAIVHDNEVSDTSVLYELLRTDTVVVADVDMQSNMNVTSVSSDTLNVAYSTTGAHTAVVYSLDQLRGKIAGESTQADVSIRDALDTLVVKPVESSSIENTIETTPDTLKVKTAEHDSHVINNIDSVADVCPVNIAARTVTDLANVHSIMKRPSRRIYGKVYITYTDPMLSSETVISSSGAAYNSDLMQVLDGNASVDNKFFTLYENDLTGNYTVSDERSQVGWTSDKLSNADGTFDGDAPFVTINFSERPIMNLQVMFADNHGSLAVDFTVEYKQADGNVVQRSVVGNDQPTVTLADVVARVVAVTITVLRVAKPGYPAIIAEVPTLSTRLYAGYQNESSIVSIDLLEELTYEDTIEALGGISANEVTVKLDNSTGEFFFNNANSVIASSLRRNRKIVPWLGIEITPGDIEWYTLGTYWSYKWDVPVEGMVATVVGFDTIGLLDTTSFTNHTVQINRSIGQLIEYILDDAKQSLNFIEYSIDPALYDVIIPYAWFEARSHTAALRKLSTCYPMHVYCNRDGVICAAPQKLRLDYYYDAWSDSTNVISKKYSSLYTALPNIINVQVYNPVVKAESKLVEDTFTFSVDQIPTRTLNFTNPYISDILVTVNCDATVEYTYEVYSWGITINFTGTGNVYSVTCIGTTLDISNSASVSRRDDNSVRINGAISRDIKSDFIQTSAHAVGLIDRLMSLSENDKYDVEVVYRGDIALTINDPILLLDGIAPDNRYNIKRHQLYWNGALSGVAYLNT